MSGNNGTDAQLPTSQEKAIEALQQATATQDRDRIIQVFMHCHNLKILHREPHMARQLKKNLGNEGFASLIEAFMKMACLNCRNGLCSCSECQGRGHDEFGMVCSSCLGLSVIPCDFCGGSGWAAIDFIPVELRMPVYVTRVDREERCIKKHLTEEHKTPETAVSEDVLKHLSRQLLDLNRHISVLEGVVGISRDILDVPSGHLHILPRLTRNAIKLATAGHRRLAGLVEQMIKTCQALSTEESVNVNTRELAKARSEFYKSLLASKPLFADTFLEHPMLLTVMKKPDIEREWAQ